MQIMFILLRVEPKFFINQHQGNPSEQLSLFERLSVDFKGPLPKSRISENRYILTIVDEYSRFTWTYPCKDTSTATVIKIYHDLFATFGTPGTIHSDRG